jgi:hypothetical protein
MKLLMTAANWAGWSFLEEVAGVVDDGWSLAPGMCAISGAAHRPAYAEKLIAALVHDPDHGPRASGSVWSCPGA